MRNWRQHLQMNRWIEFFLFLNLAGCGLEAVWRFKKKKQPWLAVYFLILPVFGFLIYYLAFFLYWLRAAGSSYDRDSLVMRIHFRNVPEHPSLEKELNIIPVEDAMAISSNQEKRTLLLEQLKKGVHTNYRQVLRAGNDQDSESAHYVAAAKMEVSGELLKQLHEASHLFDKEQENVKYYLNYLKALKHYIESALLSEREAGIYKEKYCILISGANEELMAALTAEQYAPYLEYLIELEKYSLAEAFWFSHGPEVKTEQGYFLMLRMYYEQQKEEKFLQILMEIKNTPELVLSPEGLAKFRYWIGRKEYAAS